MGSVEAERIVYKTALLASPADRSNAVEEVMQMRSDTMSAATVHHTDKSTHTKGWRLQLFQIHFMYQDSKYDHAMSRSRGAFPHVYYL
jgi:hypothetical protein